MMSISPELGQSGPNIQSETESCQQSLLVEVLQAGRTYKLATIPNTIQISTCTPTSFSPKNTSSRSQRHRILLRHQIKRQNSWGKTHNTTNIPRHMPHIRQKQAPIKSLLSLNPHTRPPSIFPIRSQDCRRVNAHVGDIVGG